MNAPIKSLRHISILICSMIGVCSSQADIGFWKNKIKPLLEQNCWKCHGADKVRAELVLTTREGVLKGGEVGPAVNLEDPASSLMLQMVSFDPQVSNTFQFFRNPRKIANSITVTIAE